MGGAVVPIAVAEEALDNGRAGTGNGLRKRLSGDTDTEEPGLGSGLQCSGFSLGSADAARRAAFRRILNRQVRGVTLGDLGVVFWPAPLCEDACVETNAAVLAVRAVAENVGSMNAADACVPDPADVAGQRAIDVKLVALGGLTLRLEPLARLDPLFLGVLCVETGEAGALGLFGEPGSSSNTSASCLKPTRAATVLSASSTHCSVARVGVGPRGDSVRNDRLPTPRGVKMMPERRLNSLRSGTDKLELRPRGEFCLELPSRGEPMPRGEFDAPCPLPPRGDSNRCGLLPRGDSNLPNRSTGASLSQLPLRDRAAERRLKAPSDNGGATSAGCSSPPLGELNRESCSAAGGK